MSNSSVEDKVESAPEDDFVEIVQAELLKAYMLGYRDASRVSQQFVEAYRDERIDMLEDTGKYLRGKLFKNKLEYNRAISDWQRHADTVNAMTFVLSGLKTHSEKVAG